MQLDLTWKDTNRDAYTNEALPTQQIRHAMADGLRYICEEIVEGVLFQEIGSQI